MLIHGVNTTGLIGTRGTCEYTAHVIFKTKWDLTLMTREACEIDGQHTLFGQSFRKINNRPLTTK